jgi:hypothetical protein
MSLPTSTLSLAVVLATSWVGAAKIEATPSEITAADLASALGVRWWSYRLHFDKSIKRVSVRPCELRRRPDGTWQRDYLSPGIGDARREVREITIALFIPETSEGKKVALKVGEILSRGEFEKPPDFEGTYTSSTSARMIDGCLILAYREKDPQVMTGREENMVRLFGLQIETEESLILLPSRP